MSVVLVLATRGLRGTSSGPGSDPPGGAGGPVQVHQGAPGDRFSSGKLSNRGRRGAGSGPPGGAGGPVWVVFLNK